MSATTKIDTNDQLEKLREALAKADHLDLPYHEGDVNMLLRTIQVSTHPNYGQSKEFAQLMRVGYRSRDAEVAGHQNRAYLEEGAAQKLREEILRLTHELAAKDAEISDILNGLRAIIDKDGMFDHERMSKVEALLTKHGKEASE